MKKSIRCYLASEEQLRGLEDFRKEKRVKIEIYRASYGIKVILKSGKPANIQKALAKIKDRVGDIFVREEKLKLPALLVRTYRRGDLTLSLAESCTGGLAGAMVTAVSGSSEVFWGSYVTYSNDFKLKLGVKQETLDTDGAVSENAVCQMAAAALSGSGTDVSLSISGIAGPGGGTEAKPVGTVWIGVKSANGTDGAYEFGFSGSRKSIRKKSCIASFCLLIGLAEGKNLLDSIKKTKYSKVYSNQNT